MRSMLAQYGVRTVCEEARCPNKAECFSRTSAAFMILGSSCTRNCAFCCVDHGIPMPLDSEEPERVASAVKGLGLKYVVITSVTRDDLADGGAVQFALTMDNVRSLCPDVKIELLIPDFKGSIDSLRRVLDAAPDVLNHNLETVSRLYAHIRPQAVYERSLKLIQSVKEISGDTKTKSGFMLGLGEHHYEVMDIMKDLRSAGCDFLTIGQYLRPTKKSIPVVEYIKPERFEYYAKQAYKIGFEYVASGPMVRSSMNAHEAFEQHKFHMARQHTEENINV